MIRSTSLRVVHFLVFPLLITTGTMTGQVLSGYEEVCAEDEAVYTFDHPDDAFCDEIQWTVTGGSFVPPAPGPTSTTAKVKWDKGKSSGSVTVSATKCFVESDDFGNPVYRDSYDKDKTLNVEIADPDMVNIFVVGQSSISCNSSEITLRLNVLNPHFSAGMLENIQWNAPSGWTIQGNQTISGDIYGATFPRVKISTNGNVTGLHTVSVSYSSMEGCRSASSYSRSVTFDISSCKEFHSYASPPVTSRSHSLNYTTFDFGTPSSLTAGSNYEFAAGEEVSLEPNFEVTADQETSFEALIAPCTCGSPYQEPGFEGEIDISFSGNFNKRYPMRESSTSSNDSPLEKNEAKRNLSIYPNPNDGYFWIEAGQVNGQVELQVYTPGGFLVRSDILDFTKISKWKIDLQGISTGMYIVKLYHLDGDFYQHEKISVE